MSTPTTKIQEMMRYAAEQGDCEAIMRLAGLGAPVDTPNNIGATPLWIAAAHGHVEAICALASLGANPFTPSKDGLTPFSVACASTHTAVIPALIENSKMYHQALEDLYASLQKLPLPQHWTPASAGEFIKAMSEYRKTYSLMGHAEFMMVFFSQPALKASAGSESVGTLRCNAKR